MAKHQRLGASRAAMEQMHRIHQLLQNKEYPNCTKLAKEFEVVRRTMKRDIEFMKDQMRLPIGFDTRQNGYFYTEPVQHFPELSISNRRSRKPGCGWRPSGKGKLSSWLGMTQQPCLISSNSAGPTPGQFHFLLQPVTARALRTLFCSNFSPRPLPHLDHVLQTIKPSHRRFTTDNAPLIPSHS